jgi:hypothetical protein
VDIQPQQPQGLDVGFCYTQLGPASPVAHTLHALLPKSLGSCPSLANSDGCLATAHKPVAAIVYRPCNLDRGATGIAAVLKKPDASTFKVRVELG